MLDGSGSVRVRMQDTRHKRQGASEFALYLFFYFNFNAHHPPRRCSAVRQKEAAFMFIQNQNSNSNRIAESAMKTPRSSLALCHLGCKSGARGGLCCAVLCGAGAVAVAERAALGHLRCLVLRMLPTAYYGQRLLAWLATILLCCLAGSGRTVTIPLLFLLLLCWSWSCFYWCCWRVGICASSRWRVGGGGGSCEAVTATAIARSIGGGRGSHAIETVCTSRPGMRVRS